MRPLKVKKSAMSLDSMSNPQNLLKTDRFLCEEIQRGNRNRTEDNDFMLQGASTAHPNADGCRYVGAVLNLPQQNAKDLVE